jgi:hypothetical protein
MDSPDPTVGPTTITATGALSCSSGSKMGRVPKEKRIVLDDMTREVSEKLIKTLLFHRTYTGEKLTFLCNPRTSLETDSVRLTS